MAVWLKKWGYMPEQVQDFYPTPGTISTVMYYTGIHPMTGKTVKVTTDYNEKRLQRALLQYSKPENRNLVREALALAGREDLIGNGEECLVRSAFGRGEPAMYDTKRKKAVKPTSHGRDKSAVKSSAAGRQIVRAEMQRPSKKSKSASSNGKSASTSKSRGSLSAKVNSASVGKGNFGGVQKNKSAGGKKTAPNANKKHR